MSVPKSKRGTSKLEVITKANELATHTIHICSNESCFPKKTQLFKVTQGIKFLGFRFRLTKTGKVVMTLLPEKLSHERRKLRKLVERAKQGYMTKEEVDRCYESWKAHVGNESSKKRKSPGRRARRNCHNLIICMDQYYKNLWRESKCLDLSVQENSL